MILASTASGAIGCENRLPWKLENDLKRFRMITEGGVVIMGRKTFESIGSRGLKNRLNIVVSNTLDLEQEDALVFRSIEKAVKFAKEHFSREIFLIGGTYLYCYGLQFADRIYWTLVHDRPDRNVIYDTVIPHFMLRKEKWKVVGDMETYYTGVEGQCYAAPSHTWIKLERIQ